MSDEHLQTLIEHPAVTTGGWRDLISAIDTEWDTANTMERRGSLLAIFEAAMESVDRLRDIALRGMAQPHLTHAELIEASRRTPSPATPVEKACLFPSTCTVNRCYSVRPDRFVAVLAH
jgi:hypothetical protein